MKLGDRMKQYEAVSKNKLMRQTPAIIRIDGKAFHTWTRGLEQPFDKAFYAVMAHTAAKLVESIQCAVFAYGQSDEISILLKDYTSVDTEAWFNGAVQKIVSVAASMATGYFNEFASHTPTLEEKPLAFFDARVFTVPVHEVCNYFIWRQQDCIRNSMQSCGQSFLGHKKVQGLKNQEVIDAMRKLDPPFDWYKDLPHICRYGYAYVRGSNDVATVLPEFKECRDFIDTHVQNQV